MTKYQKDLLESWDKKSNLERRAWILAAIDPVNRVEQLLEAQKMKTADAIRFSKFSEEKLKELKGDTQSLCLAISINLVLDTIENRIIRNH